MTSAAIVLPPVGCEAYKNEPSQWARICVALPSVVLMDSLRSLRLLSFPEMRAADFENPEKSKLSREWVDKLNANWYDEVLVDSQAPSSGLKASSARNSAAARSNASGEWLSSRMARPNR